MNILKDRTRTPNKREKSGFWSRLTFWYLNDTFRTGYKRPLNKYDVPKIAEDYSASNVSKKLEKIWEKELSKVEHGRKPSFSWCVVKFGVSMFGWTSILLFISSCLRLSQTYFLRFVIESLSDKDAGNSGFVWAASMCLTMLGVWFLNHKFYYIANNSGAWLKSAVISLIYKKMLRLSNGSLNSISTGHIVTLVSSDAHKLQCICKFIQFLWSGPMMLIATIVILWYNFGPSSLVAIGLICVSVILQSLLGKYFAYIRHKTVHNTDKRVSAMNEVISSMQVTKMYSWEKSFADKIHAIRKKESRCIMKSKFVRSVNKAMYASSTHLVALSTFGTFYALGGDLSLPLVFQTVSLMFTIRHDVIDMFPMAIQLAMEAYVGCKRIERFLLHEEMPTKQPLLSGNSNPSCSFTEPEVTFEGVSATWGDSLENQVLKGVSFCCNSKNNLVMLVGPIGAGKSSILMAVLNELKVQHGNVKVNGSIAYAAQQPWIFSGTLRQNILFGKDYDKEMYMKVIKACALKSDIQSFENGDMTLVGEKGVSLSGGQKARISLARAVYHDADIYLLDDPLSAVDAKVGKQIFEQCIKVLLKNKVVLLVTHQIQYIKYATDIICLKNGRASEGTLNDFLKKGVDMKKFLSMDDEDNENQHHEEENHLDIVPSHGFFLENNLSTSMLSLHSVSSFQHLPPDEDSEEERKTSGSITFQLYYDYIFKGLGWFSSIIVIMALLSGQLLLSFTDIFLAEWIKGEEQVRSNLTVTSLFYFKENSRWNLYIFAGLVFFNTVMGIFKALFFFICLVRCSRYLHDKMFKAVIRAPLYFFDTNPIGQILNRFSRDVYLLDEELPWVFFDFLNLVLLILSIIVMNCISTPYLLILLFPLSIMFLYYRNYYLRTAREIKRLEAIGTLYGRKEHLS